METINKTSERKIISLFEKYKIPSDLIDYVALWDSKISEGENLNALKEHIEILSSSKDFQEKIEADLNVGKKSIKQEKEDLERSDLEKFKKEAEISIKEVEKSIEKIQKDNKSKVDEYFKPLNSYVKAVANSEGYLNSIFIISRGGLGKTTNVLLTLKELGKEFIYISNYTTTVELVNFLYKNSDKIIVFDDFETIWKLGVKGINILKGALWGIGKDNKRLVTYLTTDKRLKAPAQFEFKGKAFFLLNRMPNDKDDLIRALLTRSLVYELNLTYLETLEILAEFVKIDYKKLSLKERELIFKFMKNNTDETSELNFRTLIKIYDLYIADKENWETLSGLVLKKDKNLILIKQFLNEYSTMKEVENKFTEVTGYSRRQFYNIKKRLEVK